jgi:hypothetical protein
MWEEPWWDTLDWVVWGIWAALTLFYFYAIYRDFRSKVSVWIWLLLILALLATAFGTFWSGFAIIIFYVGLKIK